MFSRSALLALFCAVPAFGHMLMATPKPFGEPDNGPVTGASFPCKTGGNPVSGGPVTEVIAGEPIEVTFSGSAVHEGGTCQISITRDASPTKESKWKVIHTVQGGCPGLTNFGVPIHPILPPSVPNGLVSLAWTWFPVASGQPEMYMNCANLKVTGGSEDGAAFEALPDLFVANIGNGCIIHNPSGPGFVLRVPNPGDSLEERPNGDNKLTRPVGDCDPAANNPPKDSPSVQPTSTSQTSTATSTTATTEQPSGTSPPSGGYQGTEVPTITSTITSTVTSEPTKAPGFGDSATACGTSGALVCSPDGSQFATCDAGKTTLFRPVAPGTKCADGLIVHA